MLELRDFTVSAGMSELAVDEIVQQA